MKAIIWGLGSYFKNKELYMEKNYDIVAYLDNSISGEKNGIPIIKMKDLSCLQFDCIIIMSNAKLFEMIDILMNLKLQQKFTIIPGANIYPRLPNERDFLIGDNRLIVNQEGRVFFIDEQQNIYKEVKSISDMDKLRNYYIHDNLNYFSKLSKLPQNRQFQFANGLESISRYYIEEFLRKNSKFINGRCLEVGESRYTKTFGSNVKPLILDMNYEGNDTNVIRGNLETGEGIGEEQVDCFILTSVFGCIFDVSSAARNIVKILDKGGVALITVTGNAPISRYDMERWGYFWKFTDRSLERLFSSLISKDNITIEVYGNVKACAAYLYGIPWQDLDREELDYKDPDYQVLITAVIRK